MRKEVECDLCEASSPSNRCSRCHMVYYCSAQCQKLHWFTHKVDCAPVGEMKNMLFVGGENLSSITKDETNQTTHDSCAICLSETVEHPIVLPCCGHVFCFKCLQQWQSSYSSNRREKRRDDVRAVVKKFKKTSRMPPLTRLDYTRQPGA